MHGIKTIHRLNQEACQAAEIMAKHADSDAAKDRAQSSQLHLPLTAPTEKINAILDGAKG